MGSSVRVIVIGGTGHIGGRLVPLLVDEGFDVGVLSRGRRPLPSEDPWPGVRLHRARCGRGEEGWVGTLRDADPGIVIDLLGTDVPLLFHELGSSLEHLLVCGSFWMYGPPRIVPTPEETQGPGEFEAYRRRYREILEVRERTRKEGVPFTALMPSNICGPGKVPLDCRGGRSVDAHRSHARGDPVTLPRGCDTLVAPCDVRDVARAFLLAVKRPHDAAGEILNVGPAYALTWPAVVETYGKIHGRELPIEWCERGRFFSRMLPSPSANYHFRAHMSPDIGRIRGRLGYDPTFTPEESMAAAVEWMRGEGLLPAP